MKKIAIYIIFLFSFLSSINAKEDPFIYIHLSYKVIINPDTGDRALGATNDRIEGAVQEMNRYMEDYWRGYRFVLDEIIEVGGKDEYNDGPSKWFNTDFFDDDHGSDWKEDMEKEAKRDSRFFWKDRAINIYANDGFNGGRCSFPDDSDKENIILIGSNYFSGVLLLHEIGHYFNLCHTQGCICSVCVDPPCSKDDRIDDTIKDNTCWTQNDLAIANFGKNYSALSNAEKELVDNVNFNIMSYHSYRDRLTEDQLDMISDILFAHRSYVGSGTSYFLTNSGSGFHGTSESPYTRLIGAIRQMPESAGNILYLLPGEHELLYDSIIIEKPLTLRATRRGKAIIK